ncbi:hypothetical protein FCH28_06100 [Streptomyces piniterrae]|uniref:DUF7878 domain-containing protein n=1 Tax=Streptomyces piniterrae TaxID=2571125 RepID=A0A4U0NSJ7_9ACTN|nr:hypothetical protein FCH28_06100 [Streptomyces piniterrae]
MAELLLSLEADLTISDDDHEIFSESDFPVAELAFHLSTWLNTAGESDDFELDSMSADPGLVRIVKHQDGWVVGSIFEPDSWTRPVDRQTLEAEVGNFVKSVRMGLSTIGIDPHFIPEPK